MTQVKFVAAFFLISSAAFADEPTNWHLFTKTKGGTVSLVKNLTERECRFMEARILGRPATEEEKADAAQRNEAHLNEAKKLCDGPVPERALGAGAYAIELGREFRATCEHSTEKWSISGYSTHNDNAAVYSSDIATVECFP